MKILTRKAPVNLAGGPETLDLDSRKVTATMATEQPVTVWDWDLGSVEEVLCMDGVSYPGQIPLLDSHDRTGVSSVLGSVDKIRVEGQELVGEITLSSVPEGNAA